MNRFVMSEPYLEKNALANPVKFGQEQKSEIKKLIDIADLQILPYEKAKKGIKKALNSSDPWKRYWGLIVCSAFGDDASEFMSQAETMVEKESENLVIIRAAEFLALAHKKDPVATFTDVLEGNQNTLEMLLILNSATLLKTLNPNFQFSFNEEALIATCGGDKNKEKWIKRRVDFITRN